MNLSVFIPYLVGRAAISLAATMLSVAIGWHLYTLSGDPFDLALVGAVQIIPIASLFVVSGWVVDHVSRRLILTLCACFGALILLGLATLMSGGVDLDDRVSIFAFLLLHGCIR